MVVYTFTGWVILVFFYLTSGYFYGIVLFRLALADRNLLGVSKNLETALLSLNYSQSLITNSQKEIRSGYFTTAI